LDVIGRKKFAGISTGVSDAQARQRKSFPKPAQTFPALGNSLENFSMLFVIQPFRSQAFEWDLMETFPVILAVKARMERAFT
jgi:hypothetical protein